MTRFFHYIYLHWLSLKDMWKLSKSENKKNCDRLYSHSFHCEIWLLHTSITSLYTNVPFWTNLKSTQWEIKHLFLHLKMILNVLCPNISSNQRMTNYSIFIYTSGFQDILSLHEIWKPPKISRYESPLLAFKAKKFGLQQKIYSVFIESSIVRGDPRTSECKKKVVIYVMKSIWKLSQSSIGSIPNNQLF